MNTLEIKEELYSSQTGKTKIFDVIFAGDPCYCIEHLPTGHKELFNHDGRILKGILEKINSGTGLACAESRYFFSENDEEGRLYLRRFLYMMYNGLAFDDIKNAKIALVTPEFDDIHDLRSDNLIDLRGKRLDRCEIIDNPYSTNPVDIWERFILVNSHGVYSVLNYDDGLWELLTNGGLCSLPVKENGRQQITVKDDNAPHTFSLSRFVYLYHMYCNPTKEDGIKEFLNGIKSFSDDMDGDVGHINARVWNNSLDNLLLMSKEANNGMGNLAIKFTGACSMFPCVYRYGGEPIILIDLQIGDKNLLFKCKSAEDYEFFQKVMLYYCTHYAPKIEDNEAEDVQPFENTEENILDELYRWCDHRNYLFEMYQKHPEQFYDVMGENALPPEDDIPGLRFSYVI